MKIPTHEAARRLGLHPADLIVRVSDSGGSLEDCWPELDDGYVETLRTLAGEYQPMPCAQADVQLPVEGAGSPADSDFLRVGENAARVLDKLERQDRWGGNSLSWDTLRNHTCRGVPDLENAVKELHQKELLLPGETKRGPISLNPAKKGEIEDIVRELREGRS